MSDYPDPDEEYELMYADELEMLQEEDQAEPNIIRKKSLPAKRSLDFSSPINKKPVINSNISQISLPSNMPLTPNLPPLTPDIVPENSTAANAPNKRTADDLFGDIGDIDFDEVELPSKKQKTEEENDFDLINKIIEGRKLRQIIAEPMNRLQNDSQPVYNTKDNISLDIPRWAFVPLTNSDGDRIYVRLESEESWESSLDMATGKVSFQSTYAGAWEEAQKILEKKELDILAKETQTQPLTKLESSVTNSTLWVDKYRPDTYVDLLSEEPVNRALLHWLHLWDQIVFKKEVKMKEPQQRNSFSKRTGQFQLTNKWKGKKEAEPEMDADGRPAHKVALLCGPPGVGKTTLAHLLARLAGYRPVELNASDERSTEAFRTALQSATLMRSVIDAEKRPNCLILDEIDGAPLPTVELLVKWCTATSESGKKKGKTHPLRRPVIAICNDLYATSLRPLRAVSQVVRVEGVAAARLARRVAQVARREGVGASPGACAALAARARGDVRAALQVLSFCKGRGHAQLSMEDVENAAIGTKDCNKTIMQALNSIFTINDKQPDEILKTVQAAGDYDRLVDGIFENYLSARVDARLHIAGETLSWLRYYDAVNAWTRRTQNYSLYGALALCAARCGRGLAARAPPRLQFPTQAQEMNRKKIELDSIVCAVWRARAAPRAVLRLEVLPLLPHALAVSLRSPNLQLCSENERKALRGCAGAMCDYGLRYVQQRTPEGLYAFVLEPDIYRVAFFGNEEKARPPPAVRQAIAREQQLEMIRRNEEMASRVSNQIRPNDGKSKTDTVSKEDTVKKHSRLPNHLQRLKPKEVEKSAPQVHKDFFGRVVPLSQVQRKDAVPDVISSSNVFYQYREGFNNAVRRNVRTRDML